MDTTTGFTLKKEERISLGIFPGEKSYKKLFAVLRYGNRIVAELPIPPEWSDGDLKTWAESCARIYKERDK